MIKGIENLSLREKLFMIYNTEIFPLSLRSTINFNKDEWMKDITKNIRESDINDASSQKLNIINNYKEIIESMIVGNDSRRVGIKRFMDILMDTQFSTKEDICNFLIYMDMEMNQSFLALSRENKSILYNIIFRDIIPYKLNAYEINESLQEDIRPEDDLLYSYVHYNLRYLFEMFCSSVSLNAVTFVIYMITKELPLNDKLKNDISLLAYTKIIMSDITSYNTDEVIDNCIKIRRGDINALNILDNVIYDGREKNKFTGFIEFISNKASRDIKESYKKNVICDNISDKLLAIGDNILPEAMDLHDLIIEIEKLQPDYLKDYIGELNNITYEINEKDIGYLKVREHTPICKLLYNNKFYTIIKYKEVSYLLFYIIGKNSCYGISFPSGYGGDRSLVSFNIPETLDYKLEL